MERIGRGSSRVSLSGSFRKQEALAALESWKVLFVSQEAKRNWRSGRPRIISVCHCSIEVFSMFTSCTYIITTAAQNDTWRPFRQPQHISRRGYPKGKRFNPPS